MIYEIYAAIFQRHINKHQYKSGPNKGQAPADSSRRSKNHYRVARYANGDYAVRFWNTDIITLNTDGTITLNTDGHELSPTTRNAMNEWLCKLGLPLRIWPHRKSNYSQTVLADINSRKVVVYYDCMVIQFDKVITPLQPFRARRVDTDKTKAYRQRAKESGFLDVFPVLWGAAEVTEPSRIRHPASIFDVAEAEAWPDIVRRAARTSIWIGPKYTITKRDKLATLKAIMKEAMGDVSKIVDTEETIRMI